MMKQQRYLLDGLKLGTSEQIPFKLTKGEAVIRKCPQGRDRFQLGVRDLKNRV